MNGFALSAIVPLHATELLAQPKANVTDRGSNAAAVIEKAWQSLREVIPGVPSAVIVIYDASVRRWGHFAPAAWKHDAGRQVHEVGVSPGLFETPDDLLGTLVHEAAHALLFERNPKHVGHFAGCGRDGYYHRREFRDTCRALGLQCTFRNNRYGWSNTRWPDGAAPERYQTIRTWLAHELPWGTGIRPRFAMAPKPTPKSGHKKLQCRCDPPRAICVNKTVVAQGGIVCALCRVEFRV